MNASQTMRALLATEGIFLDEPALSPSAATSSPTACAPIDREAIREILLERGTPMNQLDWLTASYPSLEQALAFEPTPWMRERDDGFDSYLPAMTGKGRP